MFHTDLFIKGKILWVTAAPLNHTIELVGYVLHKDLVIGQATLFQAYKAQFPESIDIL
jgi:hypothetical protein